MMPQVLTVRVDRPDGRPLRIWVPVLPVVLVFLPVLVLAALVAVAAGVVYRINTLRALGIGRRFVAALPGVRVDVAQGRLAFRIAIR